MGEFRRKSGVSRRLQRETALPVPRMGLGFLVGASMSLLVLASAADGVLWKYSGEREEVRARAALAESQVESMGEELRALKRENAKLRALHRELLGAEHGPAAAEADAPDGLPPCQR